MMQAKSEAARCADEGALRQMSGWSLKLKRNYKSTGRTGTATFRCISDLGRPHQFQCAGKNLVDSNASIVGRSSVETRDFVT
jgi:hypothetical protein